MGPSNLIVKLDRPLGYLAGCLIGYLMDWWMGSPLPLC